MVVSDLQKARSRSTAAISVLDDAILSSILHARHNMTSVVRTMLMRVHVCNIHVRTYGISPRATVKAKPG